MTARLVHDDRIFAGQVQYRESTRLSLEEETYQGTLSALSPAEQKRARKLVEAALARQRIEVGLDGNAFALLAAFHRQAHRAKWTAEEIQDVLNEAMSGDYDHLLVTLDSVWE